MQKIQYPYIFLAGLLFIASCAKVGPTGPTGPAGPAYTGNISGHISLYDKYGSPVLSGFATATLSLSSTTATLTNNLPVNPDNAGYYIFKDVKTGSYAVTAANTGYATTIAGNISFVLGTLNQNIKLSAIPDSFITSFKADAGILGLYDSLTLQVIPDTRARNCIIFVNNNPAVGNATTNYLLRYIVAIPAGAAKVNLLIPQQDLTNAGMASDAKAYFAAYSYVVDDKSVYADVATGKSVYNAVNAIALIDSALVP
ncbi:MAG: hypothetical protein K0Q79_3133 [Flavipsychrobacter sp.]|jgi:hypothetical protein|nr:hypothetical protein [Flavipsychrobacter sp.]